MRGAMRKLLILGAYGMLGHDLIKTFTNEYEVIGLSKKDLDISRKEETRSTIKVISPDIVIDAAGYTDVDGCEKKVHKAFAINGEGTKNVAKGCRVTGAKLVYISTDYIFDGEKGSPYDETDLPNPQNIYGESKLLGERCIEKLLDDYLIVRTQWLYGRHGRNFVEAIIALANETNRIEVVNDQVGSPTYTVDLSSTILALLSKNAKGIFHISNNGSCSWYEFALDIVKLMGIQGVEVVPISSGALNRPARRPPYSVLNCQKLLKEAGIKMRQWREALQDYVNYKGK
jgi:dTDP-4-dehydrorhamnose reductase